MDLTVGGFDSLQVIYYDVGDMAKAIDVNAVIDVRLVHRPVDVASAEPFSNSRGGAVSGGECVFIGRTREETHPQHGRLVELSYEAYETMAAKVLHDLAEQAVQQFGCSAVRVHHALGVVPPGEGSVLVQTLCAHRAEAFASCRFLIDQLKQAAPIWKKERWADGETWSAGQEAGTGVGGTGVPPVS